MCYRSVKNMHTYIARWVVLVCFGETGLDCGCLPACLPACLVPWLATMTYPPSAEARTPWLKENATDKRALFDDRLSQ